MPLIERSMRGFFFPRRRVATAPRSPRWATASPAPTRRGPSAVLPFRSPRRGIPSTLGPSALYEPAKRALDITTSLCMLLLLVPVFVVVAILIRLYDGGPVFFVQKRVGRGGREFDFPKFRSMVPDADRLQESLQDRNEQKDGVVFKIKKDPRITPLGRVLRKYSIDELPQFLCVLKGDMSLVGPRPPLPKEVALYTPAQRRRLDVLPGLTCFWQIEGRADLDFTKQVALDLAYIEQRNLLLDLSILLRTVPAVLSARGSY